MITVVVALQLLGELVPRSHGACGEDVGLDAVLVENRAQQAQSVVLPLLVRTAGVDQIAQVTQVQPDDVRCTFGGPRPRKFHDRSSSKLAADGATWLGAEYSTGDGDGSIIMKNLIIMRWRHGAPFRSLYNTCTMSRLCYPCGHVQYDWKYPVHSVYTLRFVRHHSLERVRLRLSCSTVASSYRERSSAVHYR